MNIHHITTIPNCAILCRKLLLLKIWSFKDSYSPMSSTYFLGSASSTCNETRNVVRELFISLGVTIFFLSLIDQIMIQMVHFMNEAMIALRDKSATRDFCVVIIWEIEKVLNEKVTPVNLIGNVALTFSLFSYLPPFIKN